MIKALNHPTIVEFNKKLNAFTGYGGWEVYQDFLQLMVCAFISDHTPQHPKEIEYLELLEKYHDVPNAPQLFAEMLACVMMYMKATNNEILSLIWEETAVKQELGQFFTPWGISNMMSKINMSTVDWNKYGDNNMYYCSDPSCGGGRLLVSCMKEISHDKIQYCVFHGIDIDYYCCLACALNMLFFNVNSYIVHGDCLQQKVHHVFATKHTWCGGKLYEITDRKEMERIISLGLIKQPEQ